MLLRLGKIGVLHLLVGPQVLPECEAGVRRSARHPGRPGPPAGCGPGGGHRRGWPAVRPGGAAWLSYPPDALILAEALEARADGLVTHDVRHFLAIPPGALPLRLGTPGYLLQWLRQTLTGGVG